MDPLREISAILHQARSRRGFTLDQLSKESGISKSSLKNWEGEKNLPPINRVSEITKAYGLDEKYFREKLRRAAEEYKKTAMPHKHKEKVLRKGVGAFLSGSIDRTRKNFLLNKKLGYY